VVPLNDHLDALLNLREDGVRVAGEFGFDDTAWRAMVGSTELECAIR
jgi:hypothetical protein